MRGETEKFFALVIVVVVIVVTVATLGPRLLGLAVGPEGELITALKAAERSGVEMPVAPFGTLRSTRLEYQRLSVTFEGDRARISGTLDFTGSFASAQEGWPPVTVSSLGLEVVPFVHRDGQWVVASELAPRLVGIVRALEQRRRVLHSGGADAGVPPELLVLARRQYSSLAWYIRSERERVEVAEDYRLTGDSPQRPVDEKGTRRLTLEERDGRFAFETP